MRRVLLMLLLASASAAAEIAVSDLRVVPSDTTTYSRAAPVAAAGEGFLVVWPEVYSGWIPLKSGIRAYDADGNALRPAAGYADGTTPLAVWTGNHYLVVTALLKSRYWGFPAPSFRVTRVQRDGTPSGHRDHVSHLSLGRVLSLAWNGTNALALVELHGSKRFLRLDGDGALVSETPADADIVAVAPRGDDFFLLRQAEGVAVAEGGGRYAILAGRAIAIVDGEGRLLERFAVPDATVAKSIAYDGVRWITAFLHDDGRLCTASFSGAHDLAQSCRGLKSASAPSVAAVAQRALVAWTADGQIVTDGGLASISWAGQWAEASAVDAAGLLVAWREERRIRIGGLKHDGSRRPELVLEEDASAIDVAAARDGTLVTWSAGGRIRALRLTPEGAPLFPVIDAGAGHWPLVATKGEGWLIASVVDETIVATAVNAAGIIVGVHEITRGSQPALAAGPDGYLLAVMQQPAPGVDLHLINAQGLPLGGAVDLSDDGTNPAVGCGAASCLVAWTPTNGTFAGVVVSHAGQPLFEPRQLGDVQTCCSRTVVTATSSGGFRVHRGGVFVDAARDGMPVGATRWEASDVILGGVEIFRGRAVLVYSRLGRVYARELPSRARAVRR